MSVTWANRVKETTTTTGTGALTLLGAATGGFFAFSTIGDGKTCKYTIDDGSGNVEIGQGTYTLSSNSLSRDSVETSTNSNALVNFGAGTKTVFIDVTASAISSFGSSPANPTASIGLSAVNGVATTFMRSDAAPALDQSIAPSWTGVHTFAPAARSSSTSPYWQLQTPADTDITTGNEAVGTYIGGNSSHTTATRTWAGSTTIASQRENVLVAPTYAAGSATTMTSTSTWDITGAPVAGSSITFGSAGNFTKNYALTVGGPASPSFSVGGAGITNGGGCITRDTQFYAYATSDSGSINNPLTYCAINVSNAATSAGVITVVGNPLTVQTGDEVVANFLMGRNGTNKGHGTTTFNQSVLHVVQNSNSTGSGKTALIYGTNSVAMTDTSFGIDTTFGWAGGNNCISVVANAATAGHNSGVTGGSANGLVNSGVRGFAVNAVNSVANIGGAFYGLNTGTSSQQIGVYAGLVNAFPTFVSGAIVADVGGTSSPLFVGQANTTNIFKIDSTGAITVGVWSATKIGIDALDLSISPTMTGRWTFAPTAGSGTVSPGITYTGATNTALTASQEFTAINFDLATNQPQFATGALASNRWIRFQGPTIKFVGASTLTQSSTLNVTAPAAGTNCTLTNPFAITVTGAIGCSAVSGSNIAGNNLVLSAGLGTGTGTSTVTINGCPAGSTGSAVNSAAQMFKIGTDGTIDLGDKNKAYQSGAAAAVNIYTGSGFGSTGLTIKAYGATTTGGNVSVNFVSGDSSSVAQIINTGGHYYPGLNGRPAFIMNSGGTNFISIFASTTSPSTGILGYASSVNSASPTAVLSWDENKAVSMSGLMAKYNNVSTTGQGIPAILGIDSRTGLTAADGAATTLYTATAANQLYRVMADIFATAAVTGTANYTIKWTENSTTQTLVVSATTINVLGTTVGLIRPDNATAITAQLTGTFTGTFTVASTVERIT